MRTAFLSVLPALAAIPAATLRAQIPDGATVVASFANASNPNGGLFVVDRFGTALPITGLPQDLQVANFVLRDPATGHLISGGIFTTPRTITVYELAVGPGLAATVVGTHLLGTSGASGGGINQATWLPNGQVLLATHDIVAGPAASQDLWSLNLSTGVLSPPPLGPLAGTWWNCVAVSPSGANAYVAPYFTTGQVYQVPLIGGGSPRQIARLPLAANGFQWFATGLFWDCNGDLVATATHLPLGSPGAVFRLTPSPTTTWPFRFQQYPQMSILQGGALDPVTCDLVLVTARGFGAQGALFRLSPTGIVTQVSMGPMGGWGSPAGVDIDPNPERYGAGTPSPGGMHLAWQYAPFPGGPPTLGTPLQLALSGTGSTPTVSTVFLSLQPGSIILPPPLNLQVLIGLTTAQSFPLSFAPIPTFTLLLPASPAFTGMVLYGQGVGIGPMNGLSTTEGLRLTF